jgi:uncharacterized protein (DUF885 family)
MIRFSGPARTFDLKSFHRRVLDIGSVGLDVLRSTALDMA